MWGRGIAPLCLSQQYPYPEAAVLVPVGHISPLLVAVTEGGFIVILAGISKAQRSPGRRNRLVVAVGPADLEHGNVLLTGLVDELLLHLGVVEVSGKDHHSGKLVEVYKIIDTAGDVPAVAGPVIIH